VDSIFVEGIAAVVSAILVFCGSVWLLLALVLGPRLAYFVTASITLGFLLLMGVVWSMGEPLGPVGELPSWSAVGVGDSVEETGFGPAGEYPEGGWFEANPDEKAETEAKSGAEGEAPDFLEKAIEDGDVEAFAEINEAAVDTDATRLFDRDGVIFAAVRFEPAPATTDEEPGVGGEGDIRPERGDSPAEDDPAAEEGGPAEDAEAFVVLERNPGNPLGKARMITLGTLALFVLHLLGLSWSEKRARQIP
jgi:hypothetical protein